MREKGEVGMEVEEGLFWGRFKNDRKGGGWN